MEGNARNLPTKPASAGRRRRRIRTFPVWVVFACMVPGILHYAIFRLFPSAMTAVLSFSDISGIPGSSWTWVGWANYKEFFVLQNVRDLKASLGRTGMYSLSVTIIQNALALLMAVILNGKFLKGRNFARAVYFMPVILGAAVVSTMWKLMFSTPTGPVYLFMQNVLGVENPPAILSSYKYAFPAVIGAQIWQNMGYSMVIFLAALQNISQDIYEAAYIDGANEWQVFWRITLPLIWSSVTVNTLLAIIGSLQSFELIMTITRGQFNTSTLGMMVFATAFGGSGASASGASVSGMRQGYAAAESMVLFVAVLFVTVISQFVMKRMEADQ